MLHKLSQLFKSTKSCHRRHLNENSSQYTQEIITSTCFWRNEAQLRTIFKQLLPKLQETISRKIRVGVHAGSTGCEAMTLQMASNYYDFHGPLEIISTDIDPQAIKQAKRGKFDRKHFLESGSKDRVLLPTTLMNQFTKPTYFNKIKISKKILATIEFKQCDLTSREAATRFGKFDLIFFQNALVHMTPTAAKQCVANLIETAHPQSLIFLGGTAEKQLSKLAHQFHLFPLDISNQAVYDGWSWRQTIWKNNPASHLGMEPFNPQHPDAQYRYAHAFTLQTGCDFWHSLIKNGSCDQ